LPPESLFVAGRFAAADSAYARVLAGAPNDTLATFRRGQIALLENRLSDARALLERSLVPLPASPRRRAALAEAFYRGDDFARAAREFHANGREAMAAKLESFGDRRPYRTRGGAVTIPFLQNDPLPVVEARINGRGPLRLILDTGAGELYVDSTFATEAGIPIFGSEGGRYAADQKARFAHGRIDSISLAGLTVADVPVQVRSMRAFAAVTGGAPVHGILGTTFLRHFLATIDYVSGTLVLRPSTDEERRRFDQGAPKGKRIAVPFWMSASHIMVARGTLNGRGPFLWFLDTGLAGAGFTCPRSTLEAAGVRIPEGPTLSGTGGGGRVPFQFFQADSMSLGDYRVRGVIGMLGPFPPSLERDQGFRIDGLISHGALRGTKLTFDFARMTCWVDVE
jgi:hypothetical protein